MSCKNTEFWNNDKGWKHTISWGGDNVYPEKLFKMASSASGIVKTNNLKEMKVLIKNGMAVDEKHKQYHINGLLIIKANGIPDVFYDKKTSLYKAACPDGTRHSAWVNPDGSVTLR